MSSVKSYKDLLIWQKGLEIVSNIYKLVEEFPKDELYALTSQMKRASISIPSNIAEGYGRSSTQSYISFINISRGSLFELETQLIIANELKFVKNQDLYNTIIEQILEESKMMNSFINKLELSKTNANA